MRPSGGVVPFALEVMEPRNIGEMMGRQDADRGDEKTRAPALHAPSQSPIGFRPRQSARKRPWCGTGCPCADRTCRRRGSGTARFRVAPRNVPSSPIPEATLPRRNIRTSSSPNRIVRPDSGSNTGAANSSAFLVHANREAHLAEPVQLEQTGNAGADNDRVEPLNSRLRRAGGLPFDHDCTPPSRPIAPGTLP